MAWGSNIARLKGKAWVVLNCQSDCVRNRGINDILECFMMFLNYQSAVLNLKGLVI